MLPGESKMQKNGKFTSQLKQIVVWQEVEKFIEKSLFVSDVSILFIAGYIIALTG